MRSGVLRVHRDFRRLWVGQALSKLGSRGLVVATPLLVLTVTGSPAQAGLVAFAEAAAQAAVVLPGGALSDRWNRRTIMVACDLGCAVATGGLALAVLTGHAALPLILLAGVLDTLLASVFSSASGATLPRLVPTDVLSRAVALVQARNSAVYFAGPLLGGFLFGLHPALPFAVDALSFVVSAALIARIRTRLAVVRPEPTTFRADVLAGLTFLRRQPFLRYAVANAAVLNFTFGGVLLAAIAVAQRDGASGTTIGAVVATAGLGSLAGSLLAPRLAERVTVRQAVLALLAAMTALVPLLALSTAPLVLGGVVAGCAVLGPLVNVVVVTTQTRVTPDALQGRVQSAMAFSAMAAAPLGPVVGGAALSLAGATATFLLFGGVLVLLLAGSVLGRGLRHADTPGRAGHRRGAGAWRAGGRHRRPPVAPQVGGRHRRVRPPALPTPAVVAEEA